MKLKEIIYLNKLSIVIGILGAVGGFLYWHFVGCNSGSCAITSSPINSTLYGAFMGGLLGNIIQSENHKKQIKNN